MYVKIDLAIKLFLILIRTNHVGVVPVSWSGHRLQLVLVAEEPVRNAEHTRPRVLNVVIVTPQVADFPQECVVNLTMGG